MTTPQTADDLIDGLMAIHPKGFDLSLERIEALLERFGRPQDNLPPVIHVAGTNGKGSVIAFMRTILEAAGLSVHTDTSPHLVNWHERYRLGGQNGEAGKLVSDPVLAEAISRVADANGGEAITVFEILTAVCFLLFSEHPADVALIEVGLGGRFDSTNVMRETALSVIMPVSLDHEMHLGDSIDKIAFEKAGIIRLQTPVVSARQESAALEVIEQVARRHAAPLLVSGQDFTAHEERGRLVYQDNDGLLDLPAPRLPGHHQFDNAAVAIAVIRRFAADRNLTIPAEAFEQGIANAQWPGRMQRLEPGPVTAHVPEGTEIWLDGGHNPSAAKAISSHMGSLEDRVQRPLFLICGMLTTKNPVGFFEQFAGIARRVFTVPVTGSQAAFDPDDLADIALQAGLSAQAMPSVTEALDALFADWQYDQPPRILICGTLYLVGEVLAENGTPPA